MNKKDVVVEKQKINIETENFVCPNCGGTMRYDIEKQTFSCSSCGTEHGIEAMSDSVNEYSFDDYQARERESVPFQGLAVASCQNCGFEITFDEHQVSASCPMCSSSQLAEVKQKSGLPPDGIIPFKIDKVAAQQRFRQWVKKRWFAPNDFKKKYGEGDLNGMYLPFWEYDADAYSKYTGRGGTTRTVTDKDGRTRTVTDWHYVSGFVASSLKDIQVCASEKDKYADKILPFNSAQNAISYSAEYLSGYYAEVYKLKADTCFEKAKDIMESAMKELARQQILERYDKASVDSISTQYSNVTYKHLLFPVWGSAFGYKGKTYNYLINGETGRVSGGRPYSIPKIVVFSLVSFIITVLLIIVLAYLDAA